jgi:hypothetical protein
LATGGSPPGLICGLSGRIAVSEEIGPGPARRRHGLAPGPDIGCSGCRPSIPWPRPAPGTNTRHERDSTYAPAWQHPKAGEAPGGILGKHTTVHKERGPAAHRYSRPIPGRQAITPVEDRPYTNQHKEIRNEASETGREHRTCAATSVCADQSRQHTSLGCGGASPGLAGTPKRCRRAALCTAAAAPPGQPKSLALPPRVRLADWDKNAPSTYRRPTTGRNGPTMAAETAGG